MAGQGHHHVNCQPKEYWIKLITERGYALSEDNGIFLEVSQKGAVAGLVGIEGGVVSGVFNLEIIRR